MANQNDALLNEIEMFLASAGLPPTKFGSSAVGDPNLLRNLKAGRELRSATLAKVRSFMASREVAA